MTGKCEYSLFREFVTSYFQYGSSVKEYSKSIKIFINNNIRKTGFRMREIGAIAAYLVAWLFCEIVIGIQSGFVTLVISLLFAFAIYALIAYAEHEEGDRNA
jgi:hypothetical protein